MVLPLWRNKLRASDRPDRIFDAVRELISLSGAMARQDTVTLLGVQIRRVRKTVPLLGDVPVRKRGLDTAGPVVDWGDPDDVERWCPSSSATRST